MGTKNVNNFYIFQVSVCHIIHLYLNIQIFFLLLDGMLYLNEGICKFWATPPFRFLFFSHKQHLLLCLQIQHIRAVKHLKQYFAKIYNHQKHYRDLKIMFASLSHHEMQKY